MDLKDNIREARRRCRECGAPIAGRSDKRYCSDFCRNSWNNRRNRDYNTQMRRGNSRLRRNYRILSSLLGEQKSRRVATSDLYARGFDFNWYTRVFRAEGKTPIFILYSLGYQKLPNGGYKLLSDPLNTPVKLEIPISSYGSLV